MPIQDKNDLWRRITSLDRELAAATDATQIATRESIARFLEVEAIKFAKAAEEDFTGKDMSLGRRERLTAQASVLTTMAAYIRRSDDKAGT